MANIISIEKRGPFVVFDLDDGSSVQFDLEKQVTIGKKGAPVKGLSSQLKGIMLVDVKDKFTDQGYYEFLRKMCGVKSYPCYSLAGVLARAPEFKNLEGYCRLGINAETNIKIPVSELPKALMNYAREKKTPHWQLTREFVKAWKENEGLMQSILSQKNEANATYINQLIESILNERKYGAGRVSGRFYDLFEVHRYDPASLAKYVSAMCMYEGLSVDGVTYQLRDYAMMQKALTKGEHSYEKYPRHLLTVHNITKRNYERLNQYFDEDAFKRTYDGSLETTVDDYVFICPSKTAQIKDEAVQQQHCVVAYIDRVLDGKCHIVFMRARNNPTQSLITLEVVNGRVVQAKGNHDRDTTPDEGFVIRKYERRLQQRMAA